MTNLHSISWISYGVGGGGHLQLVNFSDWMQTPSQESFLLHFSKARYQKKAIFLQKKAFVIWLRRVLFALFIKNLRRGFT